MFSKTPEFCGRVIIFTTLDPVPRGMRAVPGYFAMNYHEFEALKNNDGDVFKQLTAIAMQETRLEMLTPRKRRRSRT